MGVSTTVNRLTYNGDGSTTTFSFPYYFFSQADLLVYLYDTILGVVTTQVLNTNYTISGTPNSQGLYPNGANVVFGVAPASTSIVVVVRSPAETQSYSLLQNGTINSTALVQQMDYLTLLVQRLEDQVSRSIYVPDGTGKSVSGALPSNVALNPGAYVKVNSSGNGFTLGTPLTAFTPLDFTYTNINSVASTTNTYTLLTLPAGALLTYLVAKVNTPFQGGVISDVKASIGIGGNASLFVNNYDLFAASGPTNFASIIANYIGSFSGSTNLVLTATSTGANLNQLTQGDMTVYYSYAVV